MTAGGALAAAAVLLGFAAARELATELGGLAGDRLRAVLGGTAVARGVGSVEVAAARLRLPDRIVRAGLADRLGSRTVIAAKLGGAALGLVIAGVVSPVLPGRLAVAAVAGLAGAGFVCPDAWLERRARLRRDRFVAALPDALDMLAIGSASGRAASVVFAEIATAAGGPLADELGAAVAAIEAGRPLREALDELRHRVPAAEVGALAAALSRSRVYGSPLAEQLHDQATALRRDARRRIEERAARAAPKIQLVVALVLVPSVLLVIVAAILAHSEALLAGV